MDLDELFSAAGMLALGGWAALALAPLRPGAAQALAAWIVPSVLGLIYGALLVRYWTEAGAASALSARLERSSATRACCSPDGFTTSPSIFWSGRGRSARLVASGCRMAPSCPHCFSPSCSGP